MASKIDQTNFDKLLKWIGTSENDAAREYEHIRRVLIKIFLTRGFSNAEDLADATIDRVASKISEIEDGYTGEKIHYFLSVARFIQQEFLRKKEIQIGKSDLVRIELQTFVVSDINEEYSNYEKKCLKECFFKLKNKKQKLILNYYDTFAGEKSAHHSNLASEQSVTTQALRNKVYRIKLELAECVKKCLKKI